MCFLWKAAGRLSLYISLLKEICRADIVGDVR